MKRLPRLLRGCFRFPPTHNSVHRRRRHRRRYLGGHPAGAGRRRGQGYGGERQIVWQEVLAGEKAFKQTRSYLPVESLTALREYRVALKGPLTTPIGGGFAP